MNSPSNRVNSYERKRGLDSQEVEITNAIQTTSAADTAAGRIAGTVGGIEIDTDLVVSSKQLDFEKFMRDELEVMMAEPGNEHDPQFVEINVNGDYKMIMRNGQPFRVRRYHVAALARAKQSRVRQRKIVNPDGSMGFVEDNVLSLTYPFTVSHEPNPKEGGPWLRQLLQIPA